MLRWTLRKNGTYMSTVTIQFHISGFELFCIAVEMIYLDKEISKKSLETSLSLNLYSEGKNFVSDDELSRQLKDSFDMYGTTPQQILDIVKKLYPKADYSEVETLIEGWKENVEEN